MITFENIHVYEYKENFVVNTIGCKEETMLLYLFIPPANLPHPPIFCDCSVQLQKVGIDFNVLCFTENKAFMS